MKKKNIALTIWLLLPITIVSLLMVWIFVSLDKDRLMADAVPYGAGAGDTGNANALGEWLAGRDADEVSRAVDARREGRAIDPLDWPGGVLISIPDEYISEDSLELVIIYNEIDRSDPDAPEQVFTPIKYDDQGGYYVALEHWQIKDGRLGLIRRDANELAYVIPANAPPTVPPAELQVSEQMRVSLEVDPAALLNESP
tara:strand:+ start:8327 stop:8923 length:597 start_codon:yes stop_codon:yes gene_type:complete